MYAANQGHDLPLTLVDARGDQFGNLAYMDPLYQVHPRAQYPGLNISASIRMHWAISRWTRRSSTTRWRSSSPLKN